MRNKKATNAIFFAFAIIVAFFQCISGNYWYTIFVVPFFFAQILKNKLSDFMQFAGLFITAFTMLCFQDFYVGILIFIITSCFFYTLNLSKKLNYLYIVSVTLIISIQSYLSVGKTINVFFHSIMDGGLYFVCSMAIYLWISGYIKDACSKEKPLDQKYIDVLSRLMDIAHESINTLKKIQDDDDGK